MMRLNKKSEKGITLTTLSIAIIIMMIITSTLIYNTTSGARVRALNNMYQDITKIKDKVDLYYAKHNTIPILETEYQNVTNIQSINPNDNDKYYVVDLEALGNMNLTYGQDYNSFKTEPSNNLTNLYIINEASHSVYYVKGVLFEDTTYYTIPDESTEVELNSIINIENIEMNENIAVLRLNAVDKINGVKQIKVFVNNEEYKTYEYTSNFKELKTEILDLPLVFGVETQCYIEVTDEEENIIKSNDIILQNLTVIATVQDLQNLASFVNDQSNTFSGQTIELVNDLDLNGSEDNQWVPIGTETNYFQGIFEGNRHTIKNLYINENTRTYNGLFGKSSGTIRNVGIEGIIKTTTIFSGGIVGLSTGTIEYCFGNIQNESNTNSAGVIVGESNGTVRYCYSEGRVTGAAQIGGVIGHTTGGTVSDCYNKANVEGTSYGIGGISGTLYNSATINNCYNVGNISTTNTGYSGYASGILGWRVSGTVINCYYLEGSGMSEDENAISKTADELKALASILGTAFKEDTNNINSGYPILTWQE